MQIDNINVITKKNNINFGLNIRNAANTDKLVEYWRDKGFSEHSIQKSMKKLENYDSADMMIFSLVRFVASMFPNFFPKMREKNLPTIDLLGIKVDDVTKVRFLENILGAQIIKKHQYIPSILYSFYHLKIPGSSFSTPLETITKTVNGEEINPKTPQKVVKEIIRNFKLFSKSEQAPHEYLLTNPIRYMKYLEIHTD